MTFCTHKLIEMRIVAWVFFQCFSMFSNYTSHRIGQGWQPTENLDSYSLLPCGLNFFAKDFLQELTEPYYFLIATEITLRILGVFSYSTLETKKCLQIGLFPKTVCKKRFFWEIKANNSMVDLYKKGNNVIHRLPAFNSFGNESWTLVCSCSTHGRFFSQWSKGTETERNGFWQKRFLGNRWTIQTVCFTIRLNGQQTAWKVNEYGSKPFI